MSPGRPKLPPEQKRSLCKRVALNASEYDRLCAVAFRLRMSVNDYIRLMVIPEAVNVLYFDSPKNRNPR